MQWSRGLLNPMWHLENKLCGTWPQGTVHGNRLSCSSTKKCTHTCRLFLEQLECTHEEHEMEWEGRRGALPLFLAGMARNGDHGEARSGNNRWGWRRGWDIISIRSIGFSCRIEEQNRKLKQEQRRREGKNNINKGTEQERWSEGDGVKWVWLFWEWFCTRFTCSASSTYTSSPQLWLECSWSLQTFKLLPIALSSSLVQLFFVSFLLHQCLGLHI